MNKILALCLVFSLSHLSAKAADSTLLANHINKMMKILAAYDLKQWEQAWTMNKVMQKLEQYKNNLAYSTTKVHYEMDLYRSFIYAYYPAGRGHNPKQNAHAIDWPSLRLAHICFVEQPDSLGKSYSGKLYLSQQNKAGLSSFFFRISSNGATEFYGMTLSNYKALDTFQADCQSKYLAYFENTNKPKPVVQPTSAQAIQRFLELSQPYPGLYNNESAIFYCYKFFPNDSVYKIARIHVAQKDLDVMGSVGNRSNLQQQFLQFYNNSDKLIFNNKNGQVTGAIFDEKHNIKGKLSFTISN